jgi:iron(III) transport system ATP-binding protein
VLIGPSGCGKTSLLRAVAGLERCAAGRIAMAGVVLSDAALGVHLPPRRAASAWCSRTTRCFRT